MEHTVKVALAQIDLAVGDVVGNTDKIIAHAAQARKDRDADLVVFPELSVSGYPPEDLLFHAGLRAQVERAIAEIRREVYGITILVGFPEYDGEHIYNACAVFRDGKVLAHYRKHRLPNYSVFDEERYFARGKDAAVFAINGVRIETAEIEAAILAVPGVQAAYIHYEQPAETQSSSSQACMKCGIPGNYPGISFSNDGICHICTEFEVLSERAQAYFPPSSVLVEKLNTAAQKSRGAYDVIMLLFDFLLSRSRSIASRSRCGDSSDVALHPGSVWEIDTKLIE